MIHRLQFDFVEDLASCWAGLKNEEMPIFCADIQLAVSQYQRSFLDSAKVLFPQLLSGIDVESENIGSRVHMIDAVAVNHRRCRAELEALDRPLNLFFPNWAFRRNVDRCQQTHLACV